MYICVGVWVLVYVFVRFLMFQCLNEGAFVNKRVVEEEPIDTFKMIWSHFRFECGRFECAEGMKEMDAMEEA